MPTTLAEVREGLRAALVNAYGANVTVTAYMKAHPMPRHMYVMGPDAVEYDLAMQRGLDRWTVIIQAFSGSPEEVAAQTRLDTWLDPKSATSVKVAVESDITLGGKVASARVARSSGYREYLTKNGARILGAEFFVDIYTQ